MKKLHCVGLIKTLRAINGTSWHDTFLGLWLATLRLVQRVNFSLQFNVSSYEILVLNCLVH